MGAEKSAGKFSKLYFFPLTSFYLLLSWFFLFQTMVGDRLKMLESSWVGLVRNENSYFFNSLKNGFIVFSTFSPVNFVCALIKAKKNVHVVKEICAKCSAVSRSL